MFEGVVLTGFNLQDVFPCAFLVSLASLNPATSDRLLAAAW